MQIQSQICQPRQLQARAQQYAQIHLRQQSYPDKFANPDSKNNSPKMSQLLPTAHGVNMNRLINNANRTRLVNAAHVLLAANPASFLAISGISYLLAAVQLLLTRGKKQTEAKPQICQS